MELVLVVTRGLVFVSALFFVTLASWVVQKSNAITYGEEVLNSSQTTPWVVVVEIFEPDEELPSSSCSGTLIEADLVLTAAHCIPQFGSFRVRYGITNFADTDESFEVQGAWRHPRYSERRFGVNDVALLRLKSPIPSAKYVPLATKAQLLKAERSSTFRIYGWGIDQNNDEATYLRVTNVKNETASLKSKIGKFFNDDIWLAAGRYLKKERVYSGACRGDSGGPLIASSRSRLIQVGVVSFGAKSCDTSMPTIFMKTSYYLGDFRSAIARLVSEDPALDRTKPRNVLEPSIVGTAELGGRIICSQGEWTPNTTEVRYSWISSDGRKIAEGTSLFITRELTGAKLTCNVVAASRAGTAEASAEVAVEKALPDAITKPRIVGGSRVGSALNCETGSWNKYTATVTISWYLGSTFGLVESKDGQYVVPQGAAGRDVYCVVTGSGDGFSQRYELKISIPNKPTVSGTVKISGMPTSGYAAGDGLTASCDGAQAAEGAEQSGIRWWIRDSASGSTPSEIHQGGIYRLPPGFFSQNKGRLLICQFWVSGPGGLTVVSDAVSIVEPRVPDAPSVSIDGFSDWGSNSSAWENLQVSCKVTSYLGQSIPFNSRIEWVLYDVSAPYYPNASTPSTQVATGEKLTLTKAILEQAVLKKLGCRATITTVSGSATGYSTGKYVDYSNIQIADTTAPTYSLVSATPYNPPLRFRDPIVFVLELSDDNSGVSASSISIRAVGPDLKEVVVSRVEPPYKLSGTDKNGRYELKFSFAPSSPVQLGIYRILISLSDNKFNSTGWKDLTSLEFVGVRTD